MVLLDYIFYSVFLVLYSPHGYVTKLSSVPIFVALISFPWFYLLLYYCGLPVDSSIKMPILLIWMTLFFYFGTSYIEKREDKYIIRYNQSTLTSKIITYCLPFALAVLGYYLISPRVLKQIDYLINT